MADGKVETKAAQMVEQMVYQKVVESVGWMDYLMVAKTAG